VVVLGGAGSGKSTIWRTLAACHNHAALQLKKKNKMKSNASQSSGGATINSEDNNGSSSSSSDELNLMKPVTVYEAVNPKAVTNEEVNFTFHTYIYIYITNNNNSFFLLILETAFNFFMYQVPLTSF
jgi:ABC-type phosphate/phosphonate transport system ATPase subunit